MEEQRKREACREKIIFTISFKQKKLHILHKVVESNWNFIMCGGIDEHTIRYIIVTRKIKMLMCKNVCVGESKGFRNRCKKSRRENESERES